MKIRPGKNQVAILLTPHESMVFAQQLIKAALASGAVEDERQEPTEEKVEEREG